MCSETFCYMLPRMSTHLYYRQFSRMNLNQFYLFFTSAAYLVHKPTFSSISCRMTKVTAQRGHTTSADSRWRDEYFPNPYKSGEFRLVASAGERKQCSNKLGRRVNATNYLCIIKKSNVREISYLIKKKEFVPQKIVLCHYKWVCTSEEEKNWQDIVYNIWWTCMQHVWRK